MNVNLDDTTDINVSKTEDKDEFIISMDGRTRISFSRSELKFLQALIDSALKEDESMSRESLQKSLQEAVVKFRPQLQLILRNMKTEDIAYAIWYLDDKNVTDDIMANISRRSAEDVDVAIRDGIERRIRKERSDGNKDIENVMKTQGRNAAALLLKKILGA